MLHRFDRESSLNFVKVSGHHKNKKFSWFSAIYANGVALVNDGCLLNALQDADRDLKDDQIVKLLLAAYDLNNIDKGKGAGME